MKFKVYNDRTGETIFESENKMEAYNYIMENYDDEHEDFAHVWLKEES